MRDRSDRRVLPDRVLDLIRACQRRVPCHLVGGAALSGAYPFAPVPRLILSLTERELDRFRVDPHERFRRMAVPEEPAAG